jgi:RHS repeat-associated protein
MITDSSGNVAQRQDFLPYGETVLVSAGSPRQSITGYGQDVGVRQQFTGKLHDDETGLEFFGSRYLSTAQGRFMSPDRGAEGVSLTDPQSWNAYVYVRNRPMSYVDDDGRFPTPVHHSIFRNALPFLSGDDLAIVLQGSDYQDRMYAGQAPGMSYTHGQLNGWNPFDTPSAQRQRGDDLVDQLIKEAAALQKEWRQSHDGYNPGTLFRFGQAAHLIQDRKSWFHNALPYWYGGVMPTDWIHGIFENLYRANWFGQGGKAMATQLTIDLWNRMIQLSREDVTSTITFGPFEFVESTISYEYVESTITFEWVESTISFDIQEEEQQQQQDDGEGDPPLARVWQQPWRPCGWALAPHCESPLWRDSKLPHIAGYVAWHHTPWFLKLADSSAMATFTREAQYSSVQGRP